MKTRLSDFTIYEVQIGLGELQRRCTMSDKAPAGQAYLLMTRDDVATLWAAEKMLTRLELLEAQTERRNGDGFKK